MKRILTYIGAIISLAAFVCSAISGCEIWMLNLQPSRDATIVALVAVIFLIFPLVNSIRYEESDLQPLVKASKVVRIISRLIALGLFVFAVVVFVGVLNKPQNGRDEAVTNEFGTAFLLFASWLSLVCYVFGLRVLFSEKLLAISRNPIFLFRPDLLARYLNDKKTGDDSQL